MNRELNKVNKFQTIGLPFKSYFPNTIVLDSTNKAASIKFPLVFGGFENSLKKTRQSERLRGYQWVLVTCWASTNTHLYHVALRFDEFFHEIFKPPQITNGNLILAVLLVESNTMGIVFVNMDLLVGNVTSVKMDFQAIYVMHVNQTITITLFVKVF